MSALSSHRELTLIPHDINSRVTHVQPSDTKGRVGGSCQTRTHTVYSWQQVSCIAQSRISL